MELLGDFIQSDKLMICIFVAARAYAGTSVGDGGAELASLLASSLKHATGEERT